MKDNNFYPHNHLGGQKQTGVFFIFIGIIFLMGMSDVRILGNSPWVLMALVPFYWIGIGAYRVYQREGRISERVLFALVPVIFPFIFIAASMYGFSLAKLWPIVMIAAGLGFLFYGGRQS